MNTQIFLYIIGAVLLVKWGYELYTGNKLRKNIVGGPWITRGENPRGYWMAMLFEIGIFAVVAFMVLSRNG